jgi:riboflavin synthase
VFTGLVEATAQVRSVEPDGDGVRLEVETPLAAELAHGDSISVNGVCLTAIEPGAGSFRADVMAETLRRSSLGPLGAGDEVNVELALRAGDRLGGHMVQGHVDGTATVESVAEEGFARVLRFACDPDLLC